MVVFPRTPVFRLRQRSLVRGIALAIVSFLVSLRLGGFPDIDALHSSGWQIIPGLAAFWALVETARCIQRKWTLYQAGILILLYTDMLILSMTVVLFLYP